MDTLQAAACAYIMFENVELNCFRKCVKNILFFYKEAKTVKKIIFLKAQTTSFNQT